MKYIIASSKPWHKNLTEQKNLFLSEDFYWVSNFYELNEKLNEIDGVRYIFFLHWNDLVPESIWSKYECVCFHMTDVPYGRGGSPLQNLIIRGHKETMLTALKMVREMDAGPVYTKRPLSLEGTAQEIYLRAGEISYEIMFWMIDNEPEPEEQLGDPVIFHRRKPSESRLPKNGDNSELFNFIRMLDAPSYPHAFLEYGDFKLEFTDAASNDNELTARVRFFKKG